MADSRSIELANTILEQLAGGSGRLKLMTGANGFVALGNGVRFRLPLNQKGRPNIVEITLNGMDTYDMKFIKHFPSRFYRKTGKYVEERYETIKEYNGVYCDQLKELFEEATGLLLGRVSVIADGRKYII